MTDVQGLLPPRTDEGRTEMYRTQGADGGK